MLPNSVSSKKYCKLRLASNKELDGAAFHQTFEFLSLDYQLDFSGGSETVAVEVLVHFRLFCAQFRDAHCHVVSELVEESF